ncbi:MAG: CYTH domain-containing protein [Aestuariibacter sp.]|nr:CYTH domain-containing protein [Aestuariibacter sp.]|tara:strand:+ start:246898 stop:247566 length:669 start_codon:yes stop_codon:yes gene_type:complete
MAIETEEKFVMDVNIFNEKYREHCKERHTLSQAYINEQSDWDVLLGLDKNGQGFVLVKSRINTSSTAFPIDPKDVKEMMACDGVDLVCQEQALFKVDSSSWALRIRIIDEAEAIFCFKERIAGASRREYETSIPITSAEAIYETLTARISKVRHLFEYSGYLWEIDIFLDKNEGLCLAEIETEDTDFPLIDGLTKKVTQDRRYYNAELVENPFNNWGCADCN